jgi:hypothetical protein
MILEFLTLVYYGMALTCGGLIVIAILLVLYRILIFLDESYIQWKYENDY